MSLDGFITGPCGDMSWLSEHLGPNPTVDELVGSIGALLIGNRTFRADDPHRGTAASRPERRARSRPVPAFRGSASLHIVLVRLRDLDPSADRATFERLWRMALAPAWPLLPDGLDLVRVGLVAEQDSYVAGAVAIDLAGSILLLLVDPNWQRRGIGTTLLESAISRLLAAGVRRVHLGSGGHGYIWPGVPADLPAAVQFFESRGWTWDHQVTDLTADLRGYVAPGGVRDRPAYAGVSLTVAGPGEVAEVLAFERRHFPEWLRFFEESGDSVLLARDARGELVGSLLFAGPGHCSVFWPMLGGEMATIGCVGVAEQAREAGIGSALVVQASEFLRDAGAGTCHIGWAWQPAFYERLGYRRWRDYLMAISGP